MLIYTEPHLPEHKVSPCFVFLSVQKLSNRIGKVVHLSLYVRIYCRHVNVESPKSTPVKSRDLEKLDLQGCKKGNTDACAPLLLPLVWCLLKGLMTISLA